MRSWHTNIFLWSYQKCIHLWSSEKTEVKNVSHTSSQHTTRSMKSHTWIITLQDKDHLIILNVEKHLISERNVLPPTQSAKADSVCVEFSSSHPCCSKSIGYISFITPFPTSVKESGPLVWTTMAEWTYDWLATDRVLAGAHTLGRSLRVHIPLSQCHLSFRWSDRGKDNVVSEVSL